MKTNLYRELKERQQEEFNKFPMMFAFSDKQFAEGMEEIGLKETDTDQIYKFGNSGGFYKKTDSKKLNNLLKKQEEEFKKAIAEDKTGNGFIYDMFRYELDNHEYCITHDITDTVYTLNLTIEEINADKRLLNALEKARKDAIKWY